MTGVQPPCPPDTPWGLISSFSETTARVGASLPALRCRPFCLVSDRPPSSLPGRPPHRGSQPPHCAVNACVPTPTRALPPLACPSLTSVRTACPAWSAVKRAACVVRVAGAYVCTCVHPHRPASPADAAAPPPPLPPVPGPRPCSPDAPLHAALLRPLDRTGPRRRADGARGLPSRSLSPGLGVTTPGPLRGGGLGPGLPVAPNCPASRPPPDHVTAACTSPRPPALPAWPPGLLL